MRFYGEVKRGPGRNRLDFGAIPICVSWISRSRINWHFAVYPFTVQNPFTTLQVLNGFWWNFLQRWVWLKNKSFRFWCRFDDPFPSFAPFLQGVSVAASPVLATIGMPVRPSVCLSVRLSVTRWHWVKTTQARITKTSPTDSPMTLVFRIKNSSRNSKGFTPSEGVKWEWGGKNSQFSANNSPYLRNGTR